MKKYLFRVCLFVLLSSLVAAAAIGCTIYSDDCVSDISDNIIRLHVIGASDSEEDQQVKLLVRDAVIDQLKGLFDENTTQSEAAAIINEQLPFIEENARNVLLDNGFEPTAAAVLSECYIPTKKYENIELPAGIYNSLNVTLGEGCGQNWWCVIFPPLCFNDSSEGHVDVTSDIMLRENLEEDEYELVTSTGKDQALPVKFKFRIVDMFQEAKQGIRGLLSKLFS